MFLKIDPRKSLINFDLLNYGFLKADIVVVELRGDFRASNNSSDVSQNTDFNTGSGYFSANTPVTARLGTGTLVARNNDSSLADNSDPDNDYGVDVKLRGFTDGADVFDFRGRATLPEVYGGNTIYNAKSGNDTVHFSDVDVKNFDETKLFFGGYGNDTFVASKIGMNFDLGPGNDTLVFKTDVTVPFSLLENRDNDSALTIKYASQFYSVDHLERIQLSNGDIVPAAKCFVEVLRRDDGECSLNFFINGQKKMSVDGFYDEATPIEAKNYAACFRNNGSKGERIELLNVPGRDNIQIHIGQDGGKSEGCFVTLERADFLGPLFDLVKQTYVKAGVTMDWAVGETFTPFVPFSVHVKDVEPVRQPYIKPVDVVTTTAARAVDVKFMLEDDGATTGLDHKGVQIFFTFDDPDLDPWDWGTTVVGRNVTDAPVAGEIAQYNKQINGKDVYSIFLDQDTDVAILPIKLFGNPGRIDFEIIDASLWRWVGTKWDRFAISELPKSQFQFYGAEELLIPDKHVSVTVDAVSPLQANQSSDFFM
ncbi:hypothetical protein IB277_32700 [Ensifer sp. ENS07]|uniref:hypothetical protein n=1 Tax=Ensifer sp. ENS07 TaxID=2769274 RepID=UPI00177B8A6E|nr:hypothetical protein [Ensifer sp. ENS07]MBD9641055.1 hypothetical protein [Ensifer sp. ENS07]